ncbi:hypothetical protein EDB89DRAFT_698726 [Lactarius sanguifluus]|nr:hypothetical protein EDB89DRAFT_835170 [Lactarius sanguifluus]KAH9173484.1 hypothetical protein EDB89DRAFT_698726 [Lactarius sanguifluus]
MPPLMRVRLFSTLPIKQQNWQKLAWEYREKYHEEARLRLDDKIGLLERDILRLRNNFNLRGALEFSLDEYKQMHKFQESGRTSLLQHLLKDTAYNSCLTKVTERYQLRKEDINACACNLYHELSKHAHGNTAELVVVESEHTVTEVAALEAVFCALKTKGCFRIPLKLYLNNQEQEL